MQTTQLQKTRPSSSLTADRATKLFLSLIKLQIISTVKSSSMAKHIHVRENEKTN